MGFRKDHENGHERFNCTCAEGYTGYDCNQVVEESWLSPIDCEASIMPSAYRKGNNMYEVSSTGGHTWLTARAYCTERGAELAVTGMSDWNERTEIIDALNFRTNGQRKYLFIGLQKVQGRWRYFDGTFPLRSDLYWSQYEPDNTDDVAWLPVEENARLRNRRPRDDSKTIGVNRKNLYNDDEYEMNIAWNGDKYALCQYKCV